MSNENFEKDDLGNELPKEITDFLRKTHPFKGDDEQKQNDDKGKEVERNNKKHRNEKYNNSKKSKKKNRNKQKDEQKEKHSSVVDTIKDKALKENYTYDESFETDEALDVNQIDDIFVPEEEEKSAGISEEEAKEVLQFQGYHYDTDEPVQMVRHKSIKKSNVSIPKTQEQYDEENTFPDIEPEENFEEISESVSKNKQKFSIFENNKLLKHINVVENIKKEDIESVLDDFFIDNESGEFEEDDKKINYFKYAIIGCAVFVVMFIFFAIRSVSLSAKLGKAEDQISVYETLQQENEDLKMSCLALTEELEQYKEDGASSKEEKGTEENKKEDKKDEKEQKDKKDEKSSSEELKPTAEYDVYTVEEGDTFGSISTKIYGDYLGYKKIMDANGITDEGALQIGQKLKIPK